MKKIIIFLCLSLNSINSYARYAKCEEVYLISNSASINHYSQTTINAENIKKSLYTFVDIYDPYKLYLTKTEFKVYEDKFSNGEAIIKKLFNGDCSDYEELYKHLQSNRKKWLELLVEYKKNPLKEKNPNSKFFYEDIQKEYLMDSKEDLKKMSYDFINFMKNKKTMSKEDLIYAAPSKQELDYIPTSIIKSYIRSLDPHSDYSDSIESKNFMEEIHGSINGVGIELEASKINNSTVIKVKRLIKNSPAIKSGLLKVGDFITSIDNVKVTDNNYIDLLSKSDSKAGSKYIFMISRDQKEIKVELTTEKIALDSIKARGFIKEINNKKMLVIKMNTFYGEGEDNSTNDVIKIYQETIKKEKKIDGIVFDLRANPGGLLSESIKMTGLFLDKPFVVQTKGKDDRSLIFGKADESKVQIKEPLVVLISKGSASASEIFAGALKSYGRALIVGDSQSFGKGTVQSYTDQFSNINLGNIKVTISKFYLPNGKSTQVEGVKSNIIIPSPSNFLIKNEENYRFSYPFDQIAPIISNNLEISSSQIDSIKKNSEKRIANNDFFNNFKDMDSTFKWMIENNGNFFNSDEDIDQNKDNILNESLNICSEWSNSLLKK